MSTATVNMPEPDLEYLQQAAREEGLTFDEYLVMQSRWLRQIRERPLHPDVIALSGIIKGDVDEKQAYYDYMEKKHS